MLVKEKGTVVRRPSSTYELCNRLRKTREQLIRFLGQEPSLAELAEASSMSRARLLEVLTVFQAEEYLDTEVSSENNNATTRLDFMVDEQKATPAEIVSERVFEEQFSTLISSALNEREAFIITRRFGLSGYEPQSLKEIGQELGISRERVRQIEEEVLNRIKARTDSTKDSLVEALTKLSEFPEVTSKHCLVCNKKLPHAHFKYCSDRCRRRVVYEHGGIKPKEIRAQRLALMLSQGQLAAQIGVTKETVGTWERGVNKPDFEHFDKLFSFFNKQQQKTNTAVQVTGNSLKELRQSYGLSQEQLGEYLGVSQATVGSWERNQHQPDLGAQQKLAEMFHHPDKLKEFVSESSHRKCAICGSVLRLSAKKYCSDDCRKQGEAECRKRCRGQQVKRQGMIESQAQQLALFEVSLSAQSEAAKQRKQRRTKRTGRKVVLTEAESHQLGLW